MNIDNMTIEELKMKLRELEETVKEKERKLEDYRITFENMSLNDKIRNQNNYVSYVFDLHEAIKNRDKVAVRIRLKTSYNA